MAAGSAPRNAVHIYSAPAIVDNDLALIERIHENKEGYRYPIASRLASSDVDGVITRLRWGDARSRSSSTR
jgi:hypothetical protein